MTFDKIGKTFDYIIHAVNWTLNYACFTRLLNSVPMSFVNSSLNIGLTTRSLNNNQHNVREKILQCVRIRPHSSSLTTMENSTRNIHQPVQTCCIEKEKEGNNGNCKAICVTRNRKR